MDLTQAFKKSIKAYFEGNMPEEYNKASKRKSKYTKEYFEKTEKDLLGSVKTHKEFEDGK